MCVTIKACKFLENSLFSKNEKSEVFFRRKTNEKRKKYIYYSTKNKEDEESFFWVNPVCTRTELTGSPFSHSRLLPTKKLVLTQRDCYYKCYIPNWIKRCIKIVKKSAFFFDFFRCHFYRKNEKSKNPFSTKIFRKIHALIKKTH